MKQPIHAIGAAPSRWTTERIVGVGFVGLLHVIAIYALVTGLGQKIVTTIQHDLTVTITQEPDRAQPPVAPPKVPQLPLQPQQDTVTPPIVDIAPQGPSPISMVPAQPVNPTAADSAAQGIANTHSTPPYPPIARRLGEQGRVILRLTISPQGAVISADVAQSSGFADLDQSAVSWVITHWRYKPAIQGGSPVQSQTNAAVVFNLRNAG